MTGLHHAKIRAALGLPKAKETGLQSAMRAQVQAEAEALNNVATPDDLLKVLEDTSKHLENYGTYSRWRQAQAEVRERNSQ